MNTPILVRGQKIKISDFTTTTCLRVGVLCNTSPGITIDISCFGVDAQNKLSDDRYFIFYNQKSSPCKSIESLGQKDGDMEQFQIDLSRLPSTIIKLVFVITIDGNGIMSQINDGYLRLFDQSNEIARFSFSGGDFAKEKAIIIGEMYYKNVWRFSAVGQGFSGGLSALLKHFGGEEMNNSSNERSNNSRENISNKVSKTELEESKIITNEPQDIELLRKEAQRLIELEIDLLEKMLAVPNCQVPED